MVQKKTLAIGLVLWSWMGANGRSLSLVADGSVLSASSFKKEIRSHGASAVIEGLMKDESRWFMYLDRIATGKKEWLQIAVALRDGTNAKTTAPYNVEAAEELDIAVSESIQNQPENFLSIALPAYGLERCGDPHIEPTEQEHKRFMEKTRQALLRVKRPDILGRRNECLNALSQSERETSDH